MVTGRQRNTMIKAKKGCGFNYLLSHKAVSKGSKENTRYSSSKPVIPDRESVLCRESALLEQERLGMTISQKTFYNLLRRQPSDASNPSTIDGLLSALHESDFVY